MKWLFKYGYSVQKIDVPDAEWAIKSTHKEAELAPFLVSVNKAEPDFVFISLVAQFAEDMQELIDKITAQASSTLLEELRIELAGLGCEYMGLQHPLRKVLLGQKIAKDDNLTELTFLQIALRVRLAQSVYLNVISKYRKLASSSDADNHE